MRRAIEKKKENLCLVKKNQHIILLKLEGFSLDFIISIILVLCKYFSLVTQFNY